MLMFNGLFVMLWDLGVDTVLNEEVEIYRSVIDDSIIVIDQCLSALSTTIYGYTFIVHFENSYF